MKIKVLLLICLLLLNSQVNAAITYIDFTNGTDGAGGTVHDGLAEPADPGGSVYTMIDGTTTSTDTTHAVLAKDAFDNDTDDNYNGDFLYNVTRSLGVIITDYDADDTDDGSVLIHPEIVGQDAGDTFYILRSIKNIIRYTETDVRTAGDIAYLRANQTWQPGADDVDFDENGTADSYISVIGAGKVGDGDIDPWVDDNATLPIVDWQSGEFQFKFSSDTYWWLERLDIKNSADTSGQLHILGLSYGIYVKDCVIQDAEGNTGVYVAAGNSITFDGVSVDDCGTYGIQNAGGIVTVKSCTFNGGVGVSTNYGIGSTSGTVYVSDSTFGVTAAHDNADMLVNGTIVYCRNNTWTTPSTITKEGVIYSEDDDATFESHITTTLSGTITRGTASPRSGGADSFAILAPSSTCGANNPLTIGHPLSGGFRVWVATNAASTITIYARVDSAWDAALTAGECYITATYLNDATGNVATRATLTSTETITNDTNWTALTVTIPGSNPKRDGWVYIWFYLEEYEDATEKVDVDIKPVIS